MSTRRSIYNTVKKGITEGLYKSVRLIQLEGKERIPIIPFSKSSKEESLSRLTHIIHKLERNLPQGDYIIEAKTGHLNSSLTDKFHIEIKTPVTIDITAGGDPVEDKTHEQENFREMDLDEFKELLKENSDLKSENGILKIKIEILESQLKSTPVLNDSENKGIGGAIMKTLEDNLPDAIKIIDKIITQRDKSNELKERELDLRENGPTVKKKKVAPSRDSILSKMEALYESDENSFNETLDEMEEKDPDLYNFICDKMGLEFEEEETEE